MNTQSRRQFLKQAPVGAIIAVIAGRALAADAGKDKSTIENLTATLEARANGEARYAAFAKKADEEGYTQVGSLFRASAKAEKINREDLEKVLKKLGATPKVTAQAPEVKSTKDNLAAALKLVNEEHDDKLPDAISKARSEKNKEALRAFNYCKNSQTEQVTLFEDAGANLEKWKGGTKVIYVCEVCGLTVLALPDEKCPSCLEPIAKFVKVS